MKVWINRHNKQCHCLTIHTSVYILKLCAASSRCAFELHLATRSLKTVFATADSTHSASSVHSSYILGFVGELHCRFLVLSRYIIWHRKDKFVHFRGQPLVAITYYEFGANSFKTFVSMWTSHWSCSDRALVSNIFNLAIFSMCKSYSFEPLSFWAEHTFNFSQRIVSQVCLLDGNQFVGGRSVCSSVRFVILPNSNTDVWQFL